MHRPQCSCAECAADRRPRPALGWVAAFTGLAALVWFLVRVIPKPSRVAYPCQRAAAPLASGFVIWAAGLIGVKALQRKARQMARRSRLAVVLAALSAAAVAVWAPLGGTGYGLAQPQGLTPSDPPNTPIGSGKGIHPGRVVWVHEPGATKWDGKSGDWWDDANTDQKLVSAMMSSAIRSLAGKNTDKEGWDALFHYFNQAHNAGDAGYRAGEKIAIKINENQDRAAAWRTGQAMPSPHMVYALVSQLVEAAGVRGENITIYDASRNIGEPVIRKIRSNASRDFQAVRFVGKGASDQTAAEPDTAAPIRFADPAIPEAYLPTCVTQAKYLINFALLRAHIIFGVTLAGKNHFGSVYFPNRGGWTPAPLHSHGSRSRPMGSYNCLVDLMGHKQLGGKTLLYLVDGLYPGEHNETRVIRWASFGDQWAASLLASEDPVAIDSVGLDFLRSEPRETQVSGSAENYLHEAALANKPPSGVVYDPAKEGKALASLGVHEHWNSATERKYSRNLGKNEGIELVTAGPKPATEGAPPGRQ